MRSISKMKKPTKIYNKKKKKMKLQKFTKNTFKCKKLYNKISSRKMSAMKKSGVLSFEELKKKSNEGEIDTVLVAFTDLVGRYMGKRYDAPYFVKGDGLKQSGICDYLLTLNVDMSVNDGYKLSNWKKGYGDFFIVPDFNTCRVIDWQDKTAMIICDVVGKDGKYLNEAPRTILRNQIDRANQLGFSINIASELEYYIYLNSYRDANKSKYMNLEPIGWDIEDYHILQGTREEIINAKVRKSLRNAGIEVECTKGEYGKGKKKKYKT